MTTTCSTILIADDHPQMRKLIRRHCASGGHEFVEAGTGHEAVAAFQKHHPDFVLMDIEMPGMDGLAAARSIRSVDPDARIIFVTNHDTTAFRDAAVEAGAEGFVPKEDLAQLKPLLSTLDVRHADGEYGNTNR